MAKLEKTPEINENNLQKSLAEFKDHIFNFRKNKQKEIVKVLKGKDRTKGDVNTQAKDLELIKYSLDMKIDNYLEKMNNESLSLGNAIRFLAESASQQNHPLKILEVGDGIPLKSLGFQENYLRSQGDFMVARGNRTFEKP